MKIQEMRDFTPSELLKKVADTHIELFNLKVQIVTHQSTNNARIRKLRKELATLLTLKRERQLGIRR